MSRKGSRQGPSDWSNGHNGAQFITLFFHAIFCCKTVASSVACHAGCLLLGLLRCLFCYTLVPVRCLLHVFVHDDIIIQCKLTIAAGCLPAAVAKHGLSPSSVRRPSQQIVIDGVDPLRQLVSAVSFDQKMRYDSWLQTGSTPFSVRWVLLEAMNHSNKSAWLKRLTFYLSTLLMKKAISSFLLRDYTDLSF